jgi:peptide/nickel transport system substrate-binding protein
MKRVFLFALLVMLAVMPSLVSAATPNASAQPPTYPNATQGGDLVYGVWQPVDNLDPHKSQLLVVAEIDKPMFDSLVYMQPGDANIYPGLAESWTVSPDAKSFTFKLRQGVKFHDGTPLNADAVKKNFDWIWDLKNQPGLSHDVLGPYESAKVIDDRTVQVNFTAPDAAFLPNLAQIWGVIQSPTAREKWGDQYQFHLTGTGPFMLKEYVANDHVTMVRNPDYKWAPPIFHQGPAFLDSIEFRIIPENATRVAALETGEIQLCQQVPSQDLDRLKANPKLQLLVAPAGGIPWNIIVNVTKAPLDDLKVRQSLWYATDQAKIVDTLFKGVRSPAFWPAEKTMLGYVAEKDVPQYNPDKAKALLEEAGWKPGSDGIREKDGKKLHILKIIPADFGMDEYTTMLQQQYKAVGIDMEIQVRAISACLDAWNKGEHNLAPGLFWWPDPAFVRSFYHSSNVGRPSNWSLTNDPEMDALILKGESALDQVERDKIYRQIYQKIVDEVRSIPLMHKQWVGAAVKNLGGMSFDVTGYPNFNDAHFTK